MNVSSITKSEFHLWKDLPSDLQHATASFLHPSEMACVSKNNLELSLERYRQVFLNYCAKLKTFRLVSETLQFNPIEPGRFYCQRLIRKIIYFVRSHVFTEEPPLLPLPIEGPVFDANIKEALASQDRDLIQFFENFNRIDELSRLEIPELNENESESAQASSIRKWMEQNSTHFEEIESFDFDRYNRKAIPNEIRYFINLQELVLNGQRIVRIGDGIKQLRKLHTIDLDWNQMRSLPLAVCGIPNLETLNLTGNKLTHLPNEFSQLRKLTDLSLEFNPVKIVPPQVSKPPKLEEFSNDFPEQAENKKTIAQLSTPFPSDRRPAFSKKQHSSSERPILLPSHSSFMSSCPVSSSSSSSSSLIEHPSRLNPLPEFEAYLSSLEKPEIDPLWPDLPFTPDLCSPLSSSLKTSISSSTMTRSERAPLEDTDVAMEIMPPLEVPPSAETEDFPVRISRKRKKSEEDVSQKE